MITTNPGPKIIVFLIILCMAITNMHAEGVLTISIDQAYEMSVNHSMELKSSRYSLLAEQRRKTLDYWSSVPSLNMSLSDSRLTRYNAPDTDSISLSTSLLVPVFNGGRTRLQRNAAKVNIDLQLLLLNDTEDAIRNACFTLFHELFILQEKKRALADVVAIATRQYQITLMELEVGKAREIDAIETKLNLEATQHSLFSLETEIMSKEYAFKKTLGLDKEQQIAIATGFNADYAGITLVNAINALAESALINNNALAQSRFKIEQARIANSIANAKWLPNIKLQASMQVQGESYPLQNPGYGLKTIIEFPNELMPINFSFGVTTTPDIDYGRSFTSSVSSPTALTPIVDSQLATMNLYLSIDRHRTNQRDIVFTIEQSVFEHERLRRSQELMRNRIATKKKHVEILSLQADLGQITRVKYLEGETELVNAQLEYLSGTLSLIQAENTLSALTGIDLESLRKAGDTNQ